ncbi:MAG TPA: 3-deoxy-manno-octulosonate cytidylyltransferase [Rhodospirillales bacterium]|nr:3-deoxy-manno-octulosonate cytidylyltransferase [Rhodospirillales bacterium]
MKAPRNPIVIVPARMASRRLPGKPLADIHGEPMIVHVWRRAMEADVGPVVVAAAEVEIAEAVMAVGGRAVLTRPDHASGSDRAFEALGKADPQGVHDAVINLQGDLPTIEAAAVRATLKPLDGEADISTLACVIRSPEELGNPNVVKAVLSIKPGAPMGSVGRALYFSRSAVPSGDGPHYHHIGIYAFRREALARFVKLPPGELELCERLEQLRALENGMRIDAALVDTHPLGVDTPEDLERAREMLG